MAKTLNPIELQKHLSGVDYPASRDELVDTAREQGADEDIIRALESIPDREYDGPNAVSKAAAGNG
ncbi:hypothetical protein GCM10010156_14720 [Planobispora rosea]|uniref:DUF2795 domain-containing protein n=1 Tax=Planobispora rosea TaxID=35762 RepID=A0A8J3S0E9_PLARO|nr:DUF2795 domain-containing protein [Planobispora rosea]GGS57081.1 hypothetical protein GCM10010156_14720 [Planobispora rosea]GIH83457.1 hypothetical protein Pro02_18650 [Planobispora rosea]